MAETVKIKARVENFYIRLADEVITYPEAEIDPPPFPVTEAALRILPREIEAFEAWVYDQLFPLTGTGRTKGDATYDLEIIESDHPELIPVGWTWEWGY